MSVVAITGVSGQLARALLVQLEEDAEVEKIIGIDVAPPKFESDKLTFYKCDVRDPKIEKYFFGADTVVHLCFIIFPGYGKEAEADDVNINGSINVLESAARAGVRKVVATSSLAAYGIHPDNDRPLTEESPIRGNQDFGYARAKATVEQYLNAFSHDHQEMVVTCLRPSIVLGPSTDSDRYSAYKEKFFFVAKGREEPVQFVHEDDVARAIYLTIKQDAPGAYNVASKEPELQSTLVRDIGTRVVFLRRVSWKVLEFLAYVQWRRGKIPTPPVWMNITNRGCICMSTEKIERELGWNPTYTTRQAFMATVAQD